MLGLQRSRPMRACSAGCSEGAFWGRNGVARALQGALVPEAGAAWKVHYRKYITGIKLSHQYTTINPSPPRRATFPLIQFITQLKVSWYVRTRVISQPEAPRCRPRSDDHWWLFQKGTSPPSTVEVYWNVRYPPRALARTRRVSRSTLGARQWHAQAPPTTTARGTPKRDRVSTLPPAWPTP